ncbi:hypothetical protein ABET36_07520 [Caldifermentibacillus hisashii]|uniref:hypothetical protein n=1 Tax=Caldifermentibacillus hisashii TaxID=996558 RepID=UPI003D225EF2
MSQNLEKYYVVRSLEERDELFATIDAISLEEAKVIFKNRYKEEMGRLGERAFYIFLAKEELLFDDNNRLILPKGVGMIMIFVDCK